MSAGPRTPLIDPSGYIKAVGDPFRHGVFVFIGYSLGVVISLWLIMEWIIVRIDPLAPEVRPTWYRLFIPLAIMFFIVTVVSWLIIAGVIHLVVGGSKTEGSFEEALGIAGWSYAPELVSLPVTVGIAYLDLRGVSFDGDNPERAIQELEALTMDATGLFGIVLFLLVTVWSVYILAEAVTETHEVARDRAWLAAIIVGVGSVLVHLVF